MPRRTPEERIASMEAKIRADKLKLACAKNQNVKRAVDIRDELDTNLRTPEEDALLAALDAYIQANL